MNVYIYTDTDNNVFEVFETLEAAQAFAEEYEPACDYGDDGMYPVWEGDGDSWGWGEYIQIYKRKIKF